MQLLTKEIITSLPPMMSTEEIPLNEKIVICKFFTPDSNWSWFVFEGEPLEDGDFEFFGMVEGFEKELGYFLLSELQAVRGPFGLAVERDLFVKQIPYNKLVTE